MKTINTGCALAILSLLSLALATKALALSTEELLRLKSAGVSEEVIAGMVEAGYNDADKIVRLKEGGFRDQTLLSIVRSESGRSAAAVSTGPESRPREKAVFETTGRVKILWYLLYGDKPILQNRQVVDDARISLIGDKTVKFEWKDTDGQGLLEVFRRNAFPSPFYWDLGRDDTVGPGPDGYSWMLKSLPGHNGRPLTDGKHHWAVYLDPKDAEIVRLIEKRLSASR